MGEYTILKEKVKTITQFVVGELRRTIDKPLERMRALIECYIVNATPTEVQEYVEACAMRKYNDTMTAYWYVAAATELARGSELWFREHRGEGREMAEMLIAARMLLCNAENQRDISIVRFLGHISG